MDKVTLALLATIVYSIVALLIGWWAKGKVKDMVDYIVAGRRLGFWLTYGTITATWFCAGTVLGGAAMTYNFGVRGVIMDPIGASVCLIIFSLFFASILRKLKYLTIADFFRVRYGKTMEVISSVVQVLAYIGWLGGLLVAYSAVFQVLLGLTFEQGVLLGTIITVIYTFLGGMWSVTLTDFIQMTLLLVGLVIMIPYVISAAGGWETITTRIPADAYSILPGENFEYLGYFGIIGLTYYIASWMNQAIGSLSCQDLVQRSLAAKDEKTAKYASFAAGITYATLGMIGPLIGIWARLVIAEIEDPNLIIPTLALKLLPAPLFALFTVGLLALIMSSADSALIIPPSVIVNNLIPMVRPNISEKTKLLLTRVLVLVFAFVSLAIALWAATIYFLTQVSWYLILFVQAIPFIFGIYWRKANRTGALASVLTNVILWMPFIYYFYQQTEDIWLAIYAPGPFVIPIGAAVFVITSLLTQKKDPPKQLLDVDGRPI
ncbi:MAG: sodium:solute symporter family protein [Thermosphaera sp.]